MNMMNTTGYIIKDKNKEDTFLLYVRDDGIVHSEWVHTEWKDCCKIYKQKAYAEKVAKKVEGKVLKIEYCVDELGVVPLSVKIIA